LRHRHANSESEHLAMPVSSHHATARSDVFPPRASFVPDRIFF
jgi:hypothetical protein